MSQYIYCDAECHYAECRYAEWRYAECRYAEWRYAECRYAVCRSATWHPCKSIYHNILNIFVNATRDFYNQMYSFLTKLLRTIVPFLIGQ